MEEEVIRIEDIFCALKKRWRLIVIITLLSTAIAGIYSFYIMKPQYEASTKLFIGKEQVETESGYSNSEIEIYQKLMKTYAEIAKTKDLISSALGDSGIFLEANDVLENLTVTTDTNTQILKMAYKSGDKYEANDVLTAITNAFIVKSKELIPNGNVQVIEASQIPQHTTGQSKAINIAIGFILGLMVSTGIVFLLEYLDNSFKDKDELEKILNISVLGTIPLVESK